MAAANGRPEWECWGKAYPTDGCPAHALLCRLLDVAAVAHNLLTTHAPPALRRRLLGREDTGLGGASTLVLAHAEADEIEAFHSIVAVYEDGESLGGVLREERFLPNLKMNDPRLAREFTRPRT
jgi:hypothetical protein